ncbi:hypothetical protein DFA_09210 [Cavenderia fasciculata]|uniref:MRH domain-containing protein n=1 Tax=Cavenderia fasciculata TaxID=261658 RepID=F4Q700_CACFS|nr:uncharacterized protein DFA_09210 [Cavenderia fasciculata]EGG16182.1 hypothetical protein DFA_09210 [Cavenderia fasciculata]|eukprot:XP_004354566.1 hypothetical protein DFA_09210 [Cavenderia fasciculata]
MKLISVFILVVLAVTTVVNTQTTVDSCTYIDKYGYYYDLRALAGQNYQVGPIISQFASGWTQLFSVCSVDTQCQSYNYAGASGCSYWNGNQLHGLTANAVTQRFGPVAPGTGVNLISNSTQSNLVVNMVCSVYNNQQSTCVESPQHTYTCTIYSNEACPFYQANVIPATKVLVSCQQGASGYGPSGIPYTNYQCVVLNTSPLSQYVMLYAVIGDTEIVNIEGNFSPLESSNNGTGLWYPSQAASPLHPFSKVSFGYTVENNEQNPRFLPVVVSD